MMPARHPPVREVEVEVEVEVEIEMEELIEQNMMSLPNPPNPLATYTRQDTHTSPLQGPARRARMNNRDPRLRDRQQEESAQTATTQTTLTWSFGGWALGSLQPTVSVGTQTTAEGSDTEPKTCPKKAPRLTAPGTGEDTAPGTTPAKEAAPPTLPSPEELQTWSIRKLKLCLARAKEHDFGLRSDMALRLHYYLVRNPEEFPIMRDMTTTDPQPLSQSLDLLWQKKEDLIPKLDEGNAKHLEEEFENLRDASCKLQMASGKLRAATGKIKDSLKTLKEEETALRRRKEKMEDKEKKTQRKKARRKALQQARLGLVQRMDIQEGWENKLVQQQKDLMTGRGVAAGSKELWTSLPEMVAGARQCTIEYEKRWNELRKLPECRDPPTVLECGRCGMIFLEEEGTLDTLETHRKSHV